MIRGGAFRAAQAMRPSLRHQTAPYSISKAQNPVNIVKIGSMSIAGLDVGSGMCAGADVDTTSPLCVSLGEIMVTMSQVWDLCAKHGHSHTRVGSGMDRYTI